MSFSRYFRPTFTLDVLRRGWTAWWNGHDVFPSTGAALVAARAAAQMDDTFLSAAERWVRARPGSDDEQIAAEDAEKAYRDAARRAARRLADMAEDPAIAKRVLAEGFVERVEARQHTFILFVMGLAAASITDAFGAASHHVVLTGLVTYILGWTASIIVSRLRRRAFYVDVARLAGDEVMPDA